MKRKQKNLTIRKTANLTSKMRRERGGEHFEDTSTDKSLSVERSDSVRKTNKRDERPRTVKVQKEKEEKYDADLASMCERTCDTRSMNSIPEIDDFDEFEKKCTESRYIGPQVVPTKYVTTHIETPICSAFVSDYDLCEAMVNPKRMTQAKRLEPMRRFDMEVKFLEEVGSDIDKLILACARMDVEFKIVKTRDPNGTPRGQFSLVRRMKAEKVNENLSAQTRLYGFEVADQEFSDEKKEFSGVPKPREIHSNVISNIFSSIKRRFGF